MSSVASIGWVPVPPGRGEFWRRPLDFVRRHFVAVVVTLVLLLPDIFILWKGQPARAVAVLMVMHLAIALVTYNALVRLAPARRRSREPDRQTAP